MRSGAYSISMVMFLLIRLIRLFSTDRYHEDAEWCKLWLVLERAEGFLYTYSRPANTVNAVNSQTDTGTKRGRRRSSNGGGGDGDGDGDERQGCGPGGEEGELEEQGTYQLQGNGYIYIILGV